MASLLIRPLISGPLYYLVKDTDTETVVAEGPRWNEPGFALIKATFPRPYLAESTRDEIRYAKRRTT